MVLFGWFTLTSLTSAVSFAIMLRRKLTFQYVYLGFSVICVIMNGYCEITRQSQFVLKDESWQKFSNFSQKSIAILSLIHLADFRDTHVNAQLNLSALYFTLIFEEIRYRCLIINVFPILFYAALIVHYKRREGVPQYNKRMLDGFLLTTAVSMLLRMIIYFGNDQLKLFQSVLNCILALNGYYLWQIQTGEAEHLQWHELFDISKQSKQKMQEI